MRILVINSGSSSIKYQLFLMPQGKALRKGIIEEIGKKGSLIKNHATGLRLILQQVGDVSSVGHRVVHGGESFNSPTLIDAKVLRKIRQVSDLAPLHNPANLSGIIACKRMLHDIPQVAVFDTAFHQTLPEVAYVYGLPYEYYQKLKIRKYGFHGMSHEYITREAARLLKKPRCRVNLVTCHLGNGVSITAVRGGESVDTSMGFTPLEGLVMGTRCGDIDPSLVSFIMRKKNMSIHRLEEVLNKESGLKGISGLTNDMRLIQKEAKRGNRRARLTLDIFIYRIRKYIGAYLAILGYVDMVAFTGGIGENNRSIIKKITKGLFDNLKLKPKVAVIKTQEELLIAEKTYNLVKGKFK